MGPFEVLLELLNVYPQLPGGAPSTIRSTSLGWKVFARTEAVTAFEIYGGKQRGDAVHFTLHSGRIGEGTRLRRKASRSCKFSGQEGGSLGLL